MANYRTHGQLDTPAMTTGDRGFRGLNSYLEPEILEPGFVQASHDMRMDGNRATVRKGWDFLAGLSGISPSYTYAAGDEQVYGGGKFSDPNNDNKDWLIVATKLKAIIWNEDDAFYINYPSFTFVPGDVSVANDLITENSHNLEIGTPIYLTTSAGDPPGGLSENTLYYAIRHNANQFRVATTHANAHANIYVNITDQGTGTHTFQVAMNGAHEAQFVQAFNQMYLFSEHQRPLVWDGVTTATGDTIDSSFQLLSATASGGGDPFPSTHTAIYFNERMIGIQPADVATPTQAVTGAQTVVMSDLLTPNNVTPVDGLGGGEFYMNQGSADWTVGFSPWLEHQLVVFNRRSIHIITNIHATSIAERDTVETRYGCVSKRSIAQGGGYIFFLSDDGVMSLSSARDSVTGMGLTVSKVQGATVPLSQSIQDLIDDLNYTESVISKSAGIVHDNKYYLAVPSGAATSNTTVLVYDILNQAWVSKDTYPEGIVDWVIMPYGTGIRLFAIAATGWYMMEENAGLDDSGREIGSTAQSTTTAISAKLKTRNFHSESSNTKKFNRIRIGADVTTSDAFTIKLNSLDPDRTSTLQSYTATATDDTVIKLRSRLRGYSCNVEVDVTAGSPAFRWIEVDGLEFGGNSNRTVE